MKEEILLVNAAITSAVAAERVYLFGSHAYGTPDRDSDFDLYLVLPDGGIKPLEALRRARQALVPLKRTTPVDILADFQSRFDQRSRLNTLERKVVNDGVLLYERA